MVIHGEGAIEPSVNLDAHARIAASTGSGPHLEEEPVELHGVVLLNRALVLETTDAVEGFWGRGGPPSGVRVCRRGSEVGVVAWEKPIEHALGLRERTRLRETELDDEAILEGAEEPLDPTLRLGGVRANPADAEFLEGAANLGRLGPALELLGQGQRRARIAVEDPVTVRVGRTGEAIAADELAEEQEVAVRVLFQAEDPAEDPPRRIIEGGVEHEPRPTLFEPGVVAAVHLDEEARLRHAVPVAAMAGWAARARTAQPGRPEEALDRPPRDPQALALREQLGKVMIIHAGIAAAGEREDPGPDLLGDAAGRGPAAVTMGEGGKALLTQAGEEPTQVPQRETQELSGYPGLKAAMLHPGEEMHAVLLHLGQGNRLPDHGPRVTDSLTRQRVTNSLTYYRRGEPP